MKEQRVNTQKVSFGGSGRQRRDGQRLRLTTAAVGACPGSEGLPMLASSQSAQGCGPRDSGGQHTLVRRWHLLRQGLGDLGAWVGRSVIIVIREMGKGCQLGVGLKRGMKDLVKAKGQRDSCPS